MQEGIGLYHMPHLLRHGAMVFLVSSEGLPHKSVVFYYTQGDVEDHILTRILTCRLSVAFYDTRWGTRILTVNTYIK